MPVHEWVRGHTDKVLRKYVGGKLLSDSFIYTGGIGWLAAGIWSNPQLMSCLHRGPR